jgi:hypothetical protein
MNILQQFVHFMLHDPSKCDFHSLYSYCKQTTCISKQDIVLLEAALSTFWNHIEFSCTKQQVIYDTLNQPVIKAVLSKLDVLWATIALCYKHNLVYHELCYIDRLIDLPVFFKRQDIKSLLNDKLDLPVEEMSLSFFMSTLHAFHFQCLNNVLWFDRNLSVEIFKQCLLALKRRAYQFSNMETSNVHILDTDDYVVKDKKIKSDGFEITRNDVSEQFQEQVKKEIISFTKPTSKLLSCNSAFWYDCNSLFHDLDEELINHQQLTILSWPSTIPDTYIEHLRQILYDRFSFSLHLVQTRNSYVHSLMLHQADYRIFLRRQFRNKRANDLSILVNKNSYIDKIDFPLSKEHLLKKSPLFFNQRDLTTDAIFKLMSTNLSEQFGFNIYEALYVRYMSDRNKHFPPKIFRNRILNQYIIWFGDSSCYSASSFSKAFILLRIIQKEKNMSSKIRASIALGTTSMHEIDISLMDDMIFV